MEAFLLGSGSHSCNYDQGFKGTGTQQRCSIGRTEHITECGEGGRRLTTTYIHGDDKGLVVIDTNGLGQSAHNIGGSILIQVQANRCLISNSRVSLKSLNKRLASPA